MGCEVTVKITRFSIVWGEWEQVKRKKKVDCYTSRKVTASLAALELNTGMLCFNFSFHFGIESESATGKTILTGSLSSYFSCVLETSEQPQTIYSFGFFFLGGGGGATCEIKITRVKSRSFKMRHLETESRSKSAS